MANPQKAIGIDTLLEVVVRLPWTGATAVVGAEATTSGSLRCLQMALQRWPSMNSRIPSVGQDSIGIEQVASFLLLLKGVGGG